MSFALSKNNYEINKSSQALCVLAMRLRLVIGVIYVLFFCVRDTELRLTCGVVLDIQVYPSIRGSASWTDPCQTSTMHSPRVNRLQ